MFLVNWSTAFNWCQSEPSWNGSTPPPKSPTSSSLSAHKAMLSFLFFCLNWQGVILAELQAHDETVSVTSYCVTVKKLRQSIHRKCPSLLHAGVILLDDSAGPHIPRTTKKLLGTRGASTRLSPVSFFLMTVQALTCLEQQRDSGNLRVGTWMSSFLRQWRRCKGDNVLAAVAARHLFLMPALKDLWFDWICTGGLCRKKTEASTRSCF